MRDARYLFTPHYSGSRALVIGINQYQHAGALGYAVSDAVGFKTALIEDLGFDEQHVQLLSDANATRENILRAFDNLKGLDVGPDERIIVFFAGHGATLPSFRGDIGHLIPHDGDIERESTLIRWDELTRGADRIRAKHVLFIMDACYGGLAVTRNVHAGSARYLKDMLKRFSRQVLTAGKANEVVADANGPIENHSVFTGHLLQGLRGNAKNEAGFITANSLMNYVYTKVSLDQYSDQTPHYGHIDGDGDLILVGPNLMDLPKEGTVDEEFLVEVPYVDVPSQEAETREKIDLVKSLLPDPKSAIALHDMVVGELRRLLSKTQNVKFSVDGSASADLIPERIANYEDATLDTALIGACIAYWMAPSQTSVLQKIFARTGDHISSSSGSTAWLAMQGYPVILQIYTAGIAAVEGRRYDSLRAIFDTRTTYSGASIVSGSSVLETIAKTILEFNRMDIFKAMPGHKNNFTPMSEYLHKLLQPKLDDVFFIGSNYEQSFDEFEVLLAMSVADANLQKKEHPWFPIGRFGWKASRAKDPFSGMADALDKQREQWPPLASGLFGGSLERAFNATNVLRSTLPRLNWY